MSWLREIKNAVGIDPNSKTTESHVSPESPLFVYVKIPADVTPLDRGDQFEGPLEEALNRMNLGTITGGGSQLSDPDAGGHRHVEFGGLDVDLYDVANGLAFLRSELRRLGAPRGTALLYEIEGAEYEEAIYDS